MTQRHRGAALLAAMLTVTLVATLSAAALWQQWRSIEVEAAERSRAQSGWVLYGALDWARLILREDARSGGADHLAEPWAVALQEARLSSFLAAQASSNVDDAAQDAFLSGQILDLQARLNVNNLVEENKLSASAASAFERLFQVLGLPQAQLQTLQTQLLRAYQGRSNGDGNAADNNTPVPLRPQRVDELVWLGLTPQTVAALRPYVTLLPERTQLNLNTASAEALYAAIPGIDLADAQRLVDARERSHFATVADAAQIVPSLNGSTGGAAQVTTASRFFEVRGRLRIDHTVVDELSVVQRDGMKVRTLWHQRGAS
jgi:general secretion pathway protein K